jgi:hypothetical protein
LSEKRKQQLCKLYPGIEQHFNEIEKKIRESPLLGAKMITPAQSGKDIPAFSLSTATDIFSGAISFSKELTCVYVCSGDLQNVRIIQILF